MRNTRHTRWLPPQLAVIILLGTLVSTSARVANANEIIPSIGLSKSTDTNASDAQGFGGLAIRASVLPFLKLEGGIAYRQDSYAGGDVKVRQWPVTASAWATPFPMVYAGGGLGWYRTTYDYRGSLPIRDVTRQKVGIHLGGGVDIPMTPQLGLDLNGRYVFMQKEENNLDFPTTFDPDFWNLSAGLAIRF